MELFSLRNAEKGARAVWAAAANGMTIARSAGKKGYIEGTFGHRAADTGQVFG
jgi:hypothetical protein